MKFFWLCNFFIDYYAIVLKSYYVQQTQKSRAVSFLSTNVTCSNIHMMSEKSGFDLSFCFCRLGCRVPQRLSVDKRTEQDSII